MLWASLSCCFRVVFLNTYFCSRGGCYTCTRYVLGDVLDFVIVLFQSGVFKYILVCSGWGGGCCAYPQNVLIYAEKTALGG